MASLTANISVIEVGATIALSIVGTSTAWTGGTVFSVSGGTGATLTGAVVVNGTQATANLYAGTATGTLTISDGTNTYAITCFAAVANEVVAVGYRIPTGSLTNWRTARNNATAQIVEALFMGDSTVWGSGATYGWPYRVRKDFISNGYRDGGRGNIQISDSVGASGPSENLKSLVGTTNYGGGDNVDFIDAALVYKSTTRGDSITLQGYGRYIRLTYTKYRSCGKFTYSVDGGTPVEVDACINAASGQAVLTGTIRFDTGDNGDGLHTITIVNTGTINPPPLVPVLNLSNQTPGLTTPVTKYYVATVWDANGESLPSAELAKAFPNSSNDGGQLQISPALFLTSSLVKATIYRGDTTGGPYYKLSDSTGSTSSVFTYTEVGNATDGVTQPPTVAGTTYNTTAKESRFGIDFIKHVGIVCHKWARVGATHGSFHLDPGVTAVNNWPSRVALGLVQQTSPLTSDPTKPNAKDIKLAVCALGINTQQGATPWDIGPVTRGTQNFIDQAKATGADVAIVIPHYKYSANASYRQPYIDAMKQIATYNNVPWYDFNTVLDAMGAAQNADPHRPQNQYDAEADGFYGAILTEPATDLLADAQVLANIAVNALQGLVYVGGDFVTGLAAYYDLNTPMSFDFTAIANITNRVRTGKLVIGGDLYTGLADIFAHHQTL